LGHPWTAGVCITYAHGWNRIDLGASYQRKVYVKTCDGCCRNAYGLTRRNNCGIVAVKSEIDRRTPSTNKDRIVAVSEGGLNTQPAGLNKLSVRPDLANRHRREAN